MYFDGHSDIWTDVTIRSLNGERDILRKHHLPRLRKGQIEGSIFVIWIDPPNDADPAQRCRQIMNAVRQEVQDCDEIAIVKNYSEIEAAKAAGKFYVLIGLEGLRSIGEDLSKIDMLYDFGARHAMLSWNEENALATGVQGTPGRGLTDLGKKAVRKIIDKHMILDVSHLNDASIWDVLKIAEGPVVSSHANARALCGASRNLTDEQLLAIRDTNGVVGLNSFNKFISEEIPDQRVENLVKHAVYIADKIGPEHLGFGFDFFEFLSTDSMRSYSDQDTSYAQGIEDCTKVPHLVELMKKAGFSDAELEGIARENWMRVIKETLI
ncbi:MAG: dipeptidase [Clostridia bacterium]|nr:dipeptidase [Clostridia bacterium]